MWATLRLQVVGADHLIRPHIGAHGLTHDRAHAVVQAELDASPGAGARALARRWAAGAEDDTLSARVPGGLAVWALVEHANADPLPEVGVWVEGFAATMRGTGMDVQVASGWGAAKG